MQSILRRYRVYTVVAVAVAIVIIAGVRERREKKL
jgi:hypothetical protein